MMIESFFNKMLEFLKMENEIEYKEFSDYYKEVLAELDANWKEYSQEQGLQALFIMDNLKSNSDSRVTRKFPDAKKYKKISERTQVWVEALFVRLVQLGMNDKEIQAKIEEMYENA
ncbi:MAG TPA: hypothetical protein VJ824_09195 [Bacillota bacterium]|nr:hypothetical protein [Bacillota bacterium]